MGIVTIIHLNDIPMGYAEELAQILNMDIKLKNAMGCKIVKTTGNEFITFCKNWARKQKADMFVIILDKVAIGSISLSHQDVNKRSARIGYWISSNYWGNGYTSQAFSLVLGFAKLKSIQYICASIKEDNLGSKRIWVKNGAKVELLNNRYNVSIDL